MLAFFFFFLNLNLPCVYKNDIGGNLDSGESWEMIPTLEVISDWEVTQPGELSVYQVSFLDFLFI